MTHTVDIDARGEPQTVTVIAQDSHRNGVGGEPFVVSLFNIANPDGSEQMRMIGISFLGPNRQFFIDHTAVLDLKLAADGVITFGENSWRGSDIYGPVLADAWAAESEWDPFEECE